LDNKWPIPFSPISDPLVFGELYLVKYFGGFIYFIFHAIKNWLKNAATLATSFEEINTATIVIAYSQAFKSST